MKDMSLKARLCETPWTQYDKKKNDIATIGYDLLTDYSNATTHGKVLVYEVRRIINGPHVPKRETDLRTREFLIKDPSLQLKKKNTKPQLTIYLSTLLKGCKLLWKHRKAMCMHSR